MEEKLSVTQAWHLVQVDKAKIVDLRGPSDFARGHARGALNLPYSAKGLEERLGLLLKSAVDVILFAETTEQAEGALVQLRGGSFPVAGVIEASMQDWHDNALPVDVLVEVSLAQLSAAIVEGKIVVLDVREPIEWETGHVPDAILISLGTLKDRLHELPLEAGITVICEAGVRSSAAASLLQAEGFIGVANVPEGTGGYRNAGLPLQISENPN
ncbi:MAG: rhodanese-like domain-containing protein [SAR202 cluster bacterium]|nr:rhodanese-like domain-containing protein [SAR202 cluster bacterium]